MICWWKKRLGIARIEDARGMRVRLLHEIHRRDGLVIPKGTEMEIDSAWRGRFMLSGTVGRKAISVRHVDASSFEKADS